jgi:predicted DNA-binding transcriptional regulator YafY
LSLVEEIARGPKTMAQLTHRFGVSDRTVNRWIAAARGMGVVLSCRKRDKDDEGRIVPPWYWQIDNLDDIRPRLKSWLKLERTGALSNPAHLNDLIKGDRHD